MQQPGSRGLWHALQQEQQQQQQQQGSGADISGLPG
jgi:hypothetical protein